MGLDSDVKFCNGDLRSLAEVDHLENSTNAGVEYAGVRIATMTLKLSVTIVANCQNFIIIPDTEKFMKT
jgi:hypothetical protein